MKTTIQISAEEDREIAELKRELGFSSKKAVVMEGIKALRQLLYEQKRRRRLRGASQLVRQQSHEINKEWSPHSTALDAE